MAEKYVLLDKLKGFAHTSTSFEEVKEKLSEITEHDHDVSNKEWEQIQQLKSDSLPFSTGAFELYMEEIT